MTYTIECADGCGTFEAKHPSAKYRSQACRQRVKRAEQRARATGQAPTAPTSTSGTVSGQPTRGREPDDALVKATKLELGDKAETLDGQIAIHLARQVKAATGSAAASLAKELRVVVDRALKIERAPAPAPADDQAEPEVVDDEVEKARLARVEKARQAAG